MREEHSNGCRLFLYGPGAEVVAHEFADLTECMKRQAEIEQNLLAEGYQLAQPSSDRRSEHGIIVETTDRRRDDSDRLSQRSA